MLPYHYHHTSPAEQLNVDIMPKSPSQNSPDMRVSTTTNPTNDRQTGQVQIAHPWPFSCSWLASNTVVTNRSLSPNYNLPHTANEINNKLVSYGNWAISFWLSNADFGVQTILGTSYCTLQIYINSLSKRTVGLISKDQVNVQISLFHFRWNFNIPSLSIRQRLENKCAGVVSLLPMTIGNNFSTFLLLPHHQHLAKEDIPEHLLGMEKLHLLHWHCCCLLECKKHVFVLRSLSPVPSLGNLILPSYNWFCSCIPSFLPSFYTSSFNPPP